MATYTLAELSGTDDTRAAWNSLREHASRPGGYVRNVDFGALKKVAAAIDFESAGMCATGIYDADVDGKPVGPHARREHDLFALAVVVFVPADTPAADLPAGLASGDVLAAITLSSANAAIEFDPPVARFCWDKAPEAFEELQRTAQNRPELAEAWRAFARATRLDDPELVWTWVVDCHFDFAALFLWTHEMPPAPCLPRGFRYPDTPVFDAVNTDASSETLWRAGVWPASLSKKWKATKANYLRHHPLADALTTARQHQVLEEFLASRKPGTADTDDDTDDDTADTADTADTSQTAQTAQTAQ